MKRLFFTGLLLTGVIFSSGCFFSKKSARPKENPAMATELEDNYKVRWIDKRSAELAGQGQTPEAARAQANEEFKTRYGYTHAGGM